MTTTHTTTHEKGRHQLAEHFGGWRPSPPNPFKLAVDLAELTVAPEVDPRAAMMAVYNQWALGACTIHADIGAFTYDQILDGITPQMLSRFQGYWLERQKERSLGHGDTGAIGSDGFWAATHVGFAPENLWPYTWPGQDQNQPPADALFDPKHLPAAVVQAEGFYKLAKPYASLQNTLSESAFKAVLTNRQTISFGFTVFESFESSVVAKTGIIPMPQPGEQILGGHQTLAVGYLKSEPNYALVRNSWGPGWGIGGYFLMPWKYILNHKLAGDWTTIVRPRGK